MSRGFSGAGGCAGCNASGQTLRFPAAEDSVTCVWKETASKRRLYSTRLLQADVKLLNIYRDTYMHLYCFTENIFFCEGGTQPISSLTLYNSADI